MTIADQIQQLQAELQADPFGPNSNVIAGRIQRLRRRADEIAYNERAATGAYGLGAQQDAERMGY